MAPERGVMQPEGHATEAAGGAQAPLHSVRDLRIGFAGPQGVLPAVDGISFDVRAGEVFGVVGESGCGKSITGLSILRLLPPAARILGGEIRFAGRNLLAEPDQALRRIRGNDIAMVFQEPMTSLNPVFSVGEQIMEGLILHRRLSRNEARKCAVEALDKVGIPSPARRIDDYPHQLSGGMRQRVMIAMALSCNPKLLIADEPTTALDVTIQAQILELLRTLRQEYGMAIVLITHDLGVVAEFADDVMVMYAGGIAERATAAELFDRPLHPYTEGLLRSIPHIDEDAERLHAIDGTVPAPGEIAAGCRFRPRCGYARPPCASWQPKLIPFGGGHGAACIRHTGYASETAA
jgi:oligopeptide/dipeptide ABC transporter ATP-binding protein